MRYPAFYDESRKGAYACGFVVKCSNNNQAEMEKVCKATRLNPSRVGNILIEYALKHVRLVPAASTVMEINFWNCTVIPSRDNTLQLFPQLMDRMSGLHSN